jgi:hypothetical protein
MQVSVEVLNAPSVERRRTTDDTVNKVSLFKEELSEVATVLTSDTCLRAFRNEGRRVFF